MVPAPGSVDITGGRVIRPRVLLADDHVLIVEAFAQLLAPECDIVGTVSDGFTLVSEAERLKPEVVVLDVMMPLLNGLEAARELTRRLPRTKIVCLTMNPDPELPKEAFRVGVSGFLLKGSAGSELMAAIRAVTSGRSYLTPLVTRDLVDACGRPSAPRRAHTLTSRQREVLDLLVDGHSMRQTAAILNIAPRTVAFHKYQMMAQLRVKSTAELIQFAIRRMSTTD